jgi:hypothetical protein
MAKGQRRGNREPKKPKAAKKKSLGAQTFGNHAVKFEVTKNPASRPGGGLTGGLKRT